nr:PREDICTED: mesothelin-like protein [Latimeria chalumnae]|eukprot:XP_014351376.1 PREDICTED: mesothelin-like protein [Latimeria chalumnae]
MRWTLYRKVSCNKDHGRSFRDFLDGEQRGTEQNAEVTGNVQGPLWAPCNISEDCTSGQCCQFTGCTVGNITRSIILESTFPVNYNAEQFDKCLDNDVLKGNLGDLAQKALPDNYLQIIKNKLDQIYPSGVPEDQIKLLRSIARKYTDEQISKWSITMVETVGSLMNPLDRKWDDNKGCRRVGYFFL